MDDEIDLALLEQLRELEGDGFIRELLEIYARDSATQLEQLRVAVSHGDLVRVGNLAHALKGASHLMGATWVGDAAHALERHAYQPREGDDPVLLLRALERALPRALQRIEALVTSASGGCRDDAGSLHREEHIMATTTTAGVGFSSHHDAVTAVDEALSTALVSGDATPCLAIVYATVSYDQSAVLAAVTARLPHTAIVGASTGGVSVNGKSTEAGRSLAIAVLRSDTVRIRTSVVENLNEETFLRGKQLAKGLGSPPEGPSSTFVWFDPLTGVNVEALLLGLADGGYRAVFGGAAGQPWGIMLQTFQYHGDRAISNAAVAVAIDGLELVHDMTHGKEPIGMEGPNTRNTENVIEQMDGRPALDVWCEQLGIQASRDIEDNASWAIGVKPPEGVPYEGMFTRAPFRLDPETKTITVPVPIPEGTRIQVCVRTQEAVFDRALEMGRRLGSMLTHAKPVLALAFECAARPGPFLGPEMADREVVEVQRLIGPQIPWLGMYSWGELVPLGGNSEFHNYTLPLCILCEP